MSDFTRASGDGGRDRGRYGGRPRREYPDERPRNTEPPRDSYDPQWHRQYDDWDRQTNPRRPRDRDRDSGYGSNATGHSRGVEYWAQLAEDRQYQLEQDANSLKEKSDTIADLTDQLNQANTQIKDLQQTTETGKQTNVRLRRDLRAAEVDNDRLRILAAKQCLSNKDYALALQELDPLVEARRNELRALRGPQPVSLREVENAQSALYVVELIYAKALSGDRQDQRAIDLLGTVFKEGHRADPYFERSETREAQQQLCKLLERSRRTEDWGEATKVANLALGNVGRNPSAADLPWVTENRLIRTKLSLKQRDYGAAMNDAQFVWQTKSNVPTPIQKSIEQTIIDTIHGLQLAGEHKNATKLMLLSLKPNSRISDAAIESLASLSAKDLANAWTQCGEKLGAGEQRRVGWELSRTLKNDKRTAEAVNMLKALPGGQEPPQEQVDDLMSRLLIEIGGFKNFSKAANLAIDLLKTHGYKPLPGKATCHHSKTLLTAINEMSLLANSRDDPAKIYKDELSECWQSAFLEAKENKDKLSRDVLAQLAKTGRDLRTRWKEDAEQKRPRGCELGRPERDARERLLKNVKIAEKWATAR